MAQLHFCRQGPGPLPSRTWAPRVQSGGPNTVAGYWTDGHVSSRHSRGNLSASWPGSQSSSPLCLHSAPRGPSPQALEHVYNKCHVISYIVCSIQRCAWDPVPMVASVCTVGVQFCILLKLIQKQPADHQLSKSWPALSAPEWTVAFVEMRA